MAEHELKTWPEHFQAISRGDKTLELRRNDRDFQVGDVLWLREWEPLTESYSGKDLRVRVTHVLLGGAFGLEPGYVALSICPHVWPDDPEELRAKLDNLRRAVDQ